MACLITTGITTTLCSESQFGGLASERFYILNKSNFTVKYDANSNVTGLTASNSDKAWSFDAVLETGQVTEKLTYSDYSNFVVQTVNFSLTNITAARKAVLEKLRFGKFMVIVKYDDNTYDLLGDTGIGLKQTIGDLDSGKKHTDAKGMTLALEGSTKNYSKEIPFAAFSSLIA
ncbi:hypothetical protein WSM22_03350 [Cytophagales bacterium WSM2-2]|nr:hypothetical protein WSM22_03350 [Cytophagales bacterium WSM2-2]